jgi:D-alanyl-D-alanine carboxypeptidase/D-alanyl-D-alanine-endopeptidase (penicillin-binding protein 4)
MRFISVFAFWSLSNFSLVFAHNVALPAPVIAALQRAKVPVEALHVVVIEANGSQKTPALLSHEATTSINPASLSKLATTVAALDLLGPTFVWRTPVYVDGPIRDGTLQGNVYLRGSWRSAFGRGACLVVDAPPARLRDSKNSRRYRAR